jgi:hypothetical protein
VGYGTPYSPGGYYSPGPGGGTPGFYENNTGAYQIQTPTFTPTYTTTITPGQIWATPPALTPPSTTPNVEQATVTAAPSPQQVNTPPPFTPAITPNQINATPPALTPPAPQTPPPPAPSPNVEQVTVSATPPVEPRTVQPPTFTFDSPALTPGMFAAPYLAPSPAPQPTTSKPAGGGGSGGGGAALPKLPQQPTPQKPVVVNVNYPQQQTTQQLQPATQAYLNSLTPAQLQSLLGNSNLTPAARAAAQQALGTQTQAALNAAKAGGSYATITSAAAAGQAAAGSKTAAQAASPLQPESLVVPLVIAGAVAVAWGVTHPDQVQDQIRYVKKKVRKVLK